MDYTTKYFSQNAPILSRPATRAAVNNHVNQTGGVQKTSAATRKSPTSVKPSARRASASRQCTLQYIPTAPAPTSLRRSRSNPDWKLQPVQLQPITEPVLPITVHTRSAARNNPTRPTKIFREIVEIVIPPRQLVLPRAAPESPTTKSSSPTQINQTITRSTDASKYNWPTDNTTVNLNISGIPGLFRIDDLEANKQCGVAERERRSGVLKRLYKALGEGCAILEKAENEGVDWSLKPVAERQSHFPLKVVGGRKWDIQNLPEGYAVFQAPRQQKSKSKEVRLNKGFDLYIYGSGHQYRSANEFIAHLYWVRKGCKRGECKCLWCGGASSLAR